MEVEICICSTNLAERIPLYKYLWNIIETQMRTGTLVTITPENLNQVTERVLEAGSLLDILHLPRECCRMEILGMCRPP